MSIALKGNKKTNKKHLFSQMTYAAMSAATQNSEQFQRSSIMNSFVSKEIHDQGKI